MSRIQEFLQEMDTEAPATRAVLQRLPEDRLGWAPHPRSMTLGELGMHVATLPGAIAEMATRSAFDISTPVPQLRPSSTAEVLRAFEDSLERARSLLSEMDDAALAEPWRMLDGEKEVLTIPRQGLLRAILFNHGYHHRGQLTVYLRLLDVPVPPVYGPSADESPFPTPA